MSRFRLSMLAPLAAMLVACGAGPGNAPVLHRGLDSDPESLDPQKTRSTSAADVLRDIGEGLTSYTADGELTAGTAERWDVSEDALTYTFYIRREARWSNGAPLTAGDFVRGLQRLVSPTIAAFYANAVVDIVNAQAVIAGDLPPSSLGVEAVDDFTLVIRLERPVPYLLSLLTHPSTFPYPANDEGQRPFNGAYMLESWAPGSILQLARNPHYWDDAGTSIDRVFHHVIVEEQAQLNRYRSGELHTTSNVPPENFDAIREEYGDELRISNYLGVYYYGFNLTQPPFRDSPELRQALSMAIDRDVLVERITGRGEIAAYSWVPPGTDNYRPAQLSYTNLTQDERNNIARSLYRSAGYSETSPASVQLRFNTSATQQRIAVAVQSMWREVLGFEAELVGEEFQVLLSNIRQREITQVFRGSWIGDYNDASTFLNLMLGDNPTNMPGYASEEFDSLMQRAATQPDPARRRLYLEEAEQVLLADHAVAPLYFYVSKHLVSPAVRGWQDNVLDYHYSQHLSLDAAQ